ncbi:unnamed protein product, partial [Rotaria sordida]
MGAEPVNPPWLCGASLT